MLGSWSNTLVSVRQVTQRNAGRRTAGIDGEVALSSQATSGHGGAGASTRGRRGSPCRFGVCTFRRPTETASARYPRGDGSLSSRRGSATRWSPSGRPGSSPVPTGFVRAAAVPTRSVLVPHAQRATSPTGVDSGRRSVGRVRQNRPSSVTRRARIVPRQGHGREVAQGRGDRERAGLHRPRRVLPKAG